jgi:alpha-glucosidase
MDTAAERLTPKPKAPAKPWWRGASIYQIYPRSFLDTNGDGVGDLPGILAKLDYVASLGVEAIWVSPFFKSPMADFGYDIADYRAVDPIFGTLSDFDDLVARAHGLGLKVIIDQVLSHTSDQHPWFEESRQDRTNPKADWYVWADAREDGTPPNNWLSIFGGVAWTWEPRRGQYYLHNFLSEQPDLELPQSGGAPGVALTHALLARARRRRACVLDAINFCFHDAATARQSARVRSICARLVASTPRILRLFNGTRTTTRSPRCCRFLEEIRRLLDGIR